MMARLLDRNGFEKIIEVDDQNPPRYIKIAIIAPLKAMASAGAMPDPIDISASEKVFHMDQGKMGILTYIEQ